MHAPSYDVKTGSRRSPPEPTVGDQTFPTGTGARALEKLRAIRDSNLTLTQAALCEAIVLREGADGTTYASIPRLARDSKMGVSTAWRDRRELVGKKIIVEQPRMGKSSIRSVNLPALQAYRRRPEPMATRKKRRTPPPRRGVYDVEATPPPHGEKPLYPEDSISPYQLPNELPSSGDGQPDDPSDALVEKLAPDFGNIPRSSLKWAIDLVRSRAKTPPRSLAYFRLSLSRVFENLSAETEKWLAQEAYRRLSESDNGSRRPDLVEELKQAAAGNNLPYESESVHHAIDSAKRRIGEERRRISEINFGRYRQREAIE